MPDVVDDAVFVLEGLCGLRVGPLVDEPDLEPFVQEGHHLKALDHRLGAELDLLEDARVRPEGNGRAGPSAWRGPGHLELAPRFAAVFELQDVVVAVAIDLEHQSRGERVDDGHPDPVQSPRHLVAAALPELAPGVEGGQHHLGGSPVLELLVGAGRDPSPVVAFPYPPVREKGDVDAGGVPGHCLVDRVVHDLPDEVVETGRPGRADVHPGTLPDRIEPLEHGDVVGLVRAFSCGRLAFCLQRHRRALSTP